MDFSKQLTSVGLHDSEVKVYLYLLEQGISTPAQIAKGTSIARTNCYRVLRNLEEKDFIEVQKWGKRKAYIASDPIAMIRLMDKKKTALEQVLPDLRALLTVQRNKPKIKFYNGWDEVKEIYTQTLSATEVHTIGSTKHFHKKDPAFFRRYLRVIRRRKIFFKDILGPSSKVETSKVVQEGLRGYYSVKYLPNKHQDPVTDILMWQDHVAFISFEEPIFGTVLTNPFLAQTFRIVFSTLWDSL